MDHWACQSCEQWQKVERIEGMTYEVQMLLSELKFVPPASANSTLNFERGAVAVLIDSGEKAVRLVDGVSW